MEETNLLSAKELKRCESMPLRNSDGENIDKFFIGCSWGSVSETVLWGLISYKRDIDLDLSCVMFDSGNRIIDHIYSPLFRKEILKKFGLPPGKEYSNDNAIVHSGDDMNGDSGDDIDIDNEVISINLEKIDRKVKEVYFFLNNGGEENFGSIPHIRLRLVEGTEDDPGEEFGSYRIEGSFGENSGMILGRMVRENDEWVFQAIGTPMNDPFPGYTVHRIAEDYAGKAIK